MIKDGPVTPSASDLMSNLAQLQLCMARVLSQMKPSAQQTSKLSARSPQNNNHLRQCRPPGVWLTLNAVTSCL
jgi:hypothetical protein